MISVVMLSMILDLPLTLALVLPAPQEPAANAERFATARAAVLRAEEHAWRTLPFHPDLASGVIAAREVDQPVMLWIMNGHPAGFC